MRMEKISVRCCVDLGFNDLSGFILHSSFLTLHFHLLFILHSSFFTLNVGVLEVSPSYLSPL